MIPTTHRLLVLVQLVGVTLKRLEAGVAGLRVCSLPGARECYPHQLQVRRTYLEDGNLPTNTAYEGTSTCCPVRRSAEQHEARQGRSVVRNAGMPPPCFFRFVLISATWLVLGCLAVEALDD